MNKLDHFRNKTEGQRHKYNQREIGCLIMPHASDYLFLVTAAYTPRQRVLTDKGDRSQDIRILILFYILAKIQNQTNKL
jgi:hypothetical protein